MEVANKRVSQRTEGILASVEVFLPYLLQYRDRSLQADLTWVMPTES